jgi:hypothetical protein
MIGGSIGSIDPEKKVSKHYLIDGILIASFRGTFTSIFDKAPSKSKSRSTLLVLDVLGGRTSRDFS